MADSNDMVTGKLAITSRGFGFVRPEDRDPKRPDIFVDFEHLGTALDGDIVEVRLLAEAPQGRPAGEVMRVLKRARRNIVGVFRRTPDGGRVYPQDDRVPTVLAIPQEAIDRAGLGGELRDGQIVVAHLEEWQDRRQPPIGSLSQIAGEPDEPGVEVKVIALSNDLPIDFPEEVLKQAESAAEPDIRRELAGRLDLRRLTCFTIDPPGAQDIDDALSVRQLANGLIEVGVHIADASFFIPEGSPIDREARQRGTSVYLMRAHLPMIPQKLSSGLCSLKPDRNRLAYSVLMQLDSRGAVRDYRITGSVIRSSRRFSYEEVQRILEGADEWHAAEIRLLHLMSQVLRRRREERGSLDFDLPRPIIILDRDGIPREIRPQERLESHRLVEEFMLLANRTVAAHVRSLQQKAGRPLPFIYRVHPTPDPEEVEVLLRVLADLGIPYRVEGEVSAEDYRSILSIIQNLDLKNYVEKVALRSLTRAEYSTRDRGHFGLAFDTYTHFTSPIRRYPDLAVHRLLKRYGADGAGGRGRAPAAGPELERNLEALCTHCNDMERKAAAAEREYQKVKSMEFLAGKVGGTYAGVITGVTSFGLFVELSRYLVEGLVHISSLDGERFEYDERHFRLVGRKSGRLYRLGDRVEVKVEWVSVAERRAGFRLA
jgi:ribonuclease R